MYNKIKSYNLRGRRQPGRPFNTTTYPWRSTAIGHSFMLNAGPSMSMLQKLKSEGFIYEVLETDRGFEVVRVA